MQKLKAVALYSLPIVVMIGLIPLVGNDYALTALYVAFIIALLSIKAARHDFLALVFGFVAITLSELFFVSTGVETFTRQTLFGLIPFWLPFLWAYAFVTIKRCLAILSR
jgi:hypothetical protein